MFRSLCLLAALVTLPVSAFAMPGNSAGGSAAGTASGTAADRFAAMDTDKNEEVSWEEFEKAMPSMRKEAFETIDTNKNGAICRSEWDAFRQNHGAQGMPQGMTGAPGMSGAKAMPGAQNPPAAPAKPLIQPPAAK